MMQRAVTLVALLVFTLAGCESAAGPTDAGPQSAVDDARGAPDGVVGPGVAEAIGGPDGARVMIALRPPARSGGQGAAVDPVALADEVGRRVDDFLGRLAPGDLEAVRRYRTVSALAATVRDRPALARLAADPAVLRIDLDVGGRGALAGSVAQVGADARHAGGNEGAGVTVAILDTGVDTDNAALTGRIAHQACFGGPSAPGFCPNGSTRQTGSGAAEDDAGHGTHVTGIAAGSGAVGAPGMAPAATIVAVKILDNCSFAGCFQAFSEIVAALDHLISHQDELQVRAINMSLGTSALFSGVCDQTTAYNMAGSQAINTLRAMGALAFAASMNDGSTSQMASPACLRNVVSVAAVNGSDAVASFSNINVETDLLAPGVQIRSLALGGGTVGQSGTSMATPHAAGCAALLAQQAPGATSDELADRLLDSSVQVTDSRNGVALPRLDCRPDPGPPDPRTTATVPRPGG